MLTCRAKYLGQLIVGQPHSSANPILLVTYTISVGLLFPTAVERASLFTLILVYPFLITHNEIRIEKQKLKASLILLSLVCLPLLGTRNFKLS